MNPRTSFRIRKAWQEAAKALGFEFTAPFAIDAKEGKTKYLGLVLKFGSAKGTVLIFESGDGSKKERSIAEAAGYGWSVMNSGDFHEFKRSSFEAVLRDWGWFGSVLEMPAFLERKPNPEPKKESGFAFCSPNLAPTLSPAIASRPRSEPSR